jgi:hypothetical protein
LRIVKEFSKVLDKNGKIAISLKTDTPLKAEICFKHLSNSHMTWFLAPRVPEEEFDEEED